MAGKSVAPSMQKKGSGPERRGRSGKLEQLRPMGLGGHLQSTGVSTYIQIFSRVRGQPVTFLSKSHFHHYVTLPAKYRLW